MTDDEALELRASLRDVCDLPVAARYLATESVVMDLLYSQRFDDALLDELTAIVDELDSRTARRRFASLSTLILARAGEYGEAADRCDELLAGLDDLTNFVDLQTAVRLLRFRAHAGLATRPADLRRPWEWMERHGAWQQTWHAALSVAGVSHVDGEFGLRDRLLSACLNEVGRHEMDGFIYAGGWDMTEVIESLEPSSEVVADVVPAILEWADRLESGRA